ncbi:hypothetical protein HU200_011977 [Digitaria exilis]|uniref:Uncharacterized protein n=1 Tax=Digitaria exilis TaxID=1010633 RepID=A0A835KKX3_9POAL|nr:hypothetical protein HU200_011977 [Digitaria exilis]
MSWNCRRKHDLICPLLLSLSSRSTNLKLELLRDIPAGKVPSTEESSSSDKSDWKFRAQYRYTAAHRLLVETKKGARPSKTTDHTKQQGGLPQGSYVIGGSPIGWNFLMWPGCKAVFYGLTKAEWLARRSAK